MWPRRDAPAPAALSAGSAPGGSGSAACPQPFRQGRGEGGRHPLRGADPRGSRPGRSGSDGGGRTSPTLRALKGFAL